MKVIPLVKQKSVFLVILLQMISCIWYLLPENNHVHVPGGFVKMIVFGSIALLLLAITSILYFIYKPSELIWKVPFVIFIIMIVLAWFF